MENYRRPKGNSGCSSRRSDAWRRFRWLAQRLKDPEVLRVVLSIGPTEAMHFQTWQDKAGNATPVTVLDPINNSTATFVDLTASTDEHLQANLIMPEPCPFPPAAQH